MPASDKRQRSALLSFVTPVLSSGERVVAVLPYANTPKRPRGPEGKVRVGIWQSWRRYRPLLLTDRRLFVFETGRTPNPRAVLCEVPKGAVRVVRTVPGSMGRTTLVLELPADGEVPFELGRFDVEQLDAFTGALEGRPDS
jgi:hypothetical protein